MMNGGGLFAAVTEKQENDDAISRPQAPVGNSTEPSVRAHADQLWREAPWQPDAAIAGRQRAGGEPSAGEVEAGGADMTDKPVPPRSAPTEAEAKETGRKLFEGLARVNTFPVDPSGPGQPPRKMLPVSSFLRKEADQPVPQFASVGPNVHANAHDAVIMVRLMRNNPGRAFKDVKKMAREAGLLGHDPIAQAMSRHPGLTREEAEEMAKDFGF